MSDNAAASQFSKSLSQLTNDTDRLYTSLSQVLRALAKNGVQISVDLDGMMQAVHRDVQSLRDESQRIMEELKTVERMEALVHTSALITSSLDLDQVLEGVIDTIIELTGSERAYLMLLNDHGELTIRAARNWNQESLSDNDAMFSRSIVNAALEQGQPIVTTNAQADERFQTNKSVIGQALRSILCVPLILRDRPVGVLYADNRMVQGVFKEDIVPIMTAFGNQAAIAIENARAFGQVKADLYVAQREVERLRIQIDQDKVDRQVVEITESEYFQQLEAMARNIRQKTNK
jgi:GAF domain-containing protein